MAKFLFIVPPFYGHITATLSIGAELIQRGHEVNWVGIKPIENGYVPRGGTFIVPHKEIEPHLEEIDRILRIQDCGTSVLGVKAFDFEMEETAIPFARIMYDGVMRVIDEVRPDAIIHDESALIGSICADLKGLPYATSITVPPGFFVPEILFPESKKILFERMLAFQREFGINHDRLLLNSSKLVLSYTSKELLLPIYANAPFPTQFQFVGATVEGRTTSIDFDWDKFDSTENPKVYVSIGTVLNEIKHSFFSKVVEAFKGKPLTVIVNTDLTLFDNWPSNFIIQAVCPQLEIISKVDLVITHGGFNTVNECLFFNKPMIVMPLAWDQFGNAEMVVRNGCGVKLKYKRLRSNDLYEATELLLKDVTYRIRAEYIGETIRSGGGTKKAAELIETLLK